MKELGTVQAELKVIPRRQLCGAFVMMMIDDDGKPRLLKSFQCEFVLLEARQLNTTRESRENERKRLREEDCKTR